MRKNKEEGKKEKRKPHKKSARKGTESGSKAPGESGATFLENLPAETRGSVLILSPVTFLFFCLRDGTVSCVSVRFPSTLSVADRQSSEQKNE